MVQLEKVSRNVCGMSKGAFIKYVRSEGKGVGLTKANIPYKNCPFPYMKSDQGGVMSERTF